MIPGMLFGRLRVPVERALAPEARERRERYGSGFYVAGEALRGEAPALDPDADPARAVSPRLALVPRPMPEGTGDSCEGDDPFAGLERLDREELDEE